MSDRKPQLLTERAVFRPRSLEEPSKREALPLHSASSIAPPQHEFDPLTTGEYRVPILYLGRDELIAVLPEHETRIRQLTDLEIEALALEIEGSLTELYVMALRIAWTAFLSSQPALR
jgi:hypothetical protein